MELRLRTISDLSEARQQFVNTDGTQAVRPWVAFLKFSAVQALNVPSIFMRMVPRMIMTKFSPYLAFYLTDLIFIALSETVSLIIPTLQMRTLRHIGLHGLPKVTQIRDKEESPSDRARALDCTTVSPVCCW